MSLAQTMVVFDLDDTLYLEREFVRSGFAAVEQALIERGFAQAEYAATFLRLIDQNGSGRVFNDALAEHSINDDSALIGDLVWVYRHHTPTISPLPGIPQCLDVLEAAGARLGVITDGADSIQRAKLKALGLSERFEVILPTDTLGPERMGWKPSPLPFETVEQRAELSGDVMTYVGDNPLKDFQGARSRGWRVARLRLPGQLKHPLKTPEGVAEFTSVAALQAHLLEAGATGRMQGNAA